MLCHNITPQDRVKNSQRTGRLAHRRALLLLSTLTEDKLWATRCAGLGFHEIYGNASLQCRDWHFWESNDHNGALKVVPNNFHWRCDFFSWRTSEKKSLPHGRFNLLSLIFAGSRQLKLWGVKTWKKWLRQRKVTCSTKLRKSPPFSREPFFHRKKKTDKKLDGQGMKFDGGKILLTPRITNNCLTFAKALGHARYDRHAVAHLAQVLCVWRVRWQGGWWVLLLTPIF